MHRWIHFLYRSFVVNWRSKYFKQFFWSIFTLILTTLCKHQSFFSPAQADVYSGILWAKHPPEKDSSEPAYPERKLLSWLQRMTVGLLPPSLALHQLLNLVQVHELIWCRLEVEGHHAMHLSILQTDGSTGLYTVAWITASKRHNNEENRRDRSFSYLKENIKIFTRFALFPL